ncbi:MAG TPA: class I SAM-dependent methyltransferase [Gaiellaceae bacterium]|jgi:SAM-dependent methyltransferase
MAFEELKQMQGVMWGEGNFDEVADSIEDVHAAVAQAALPAVGERWLDVACGTGRVAEIAAAGGADVVGIDLAPALIDVAKRRAAERELDIEYRVGDAERLDVPDASFDVVTSSFGVMFAPSQEVAAGELARVTKPGGRLSLSCWTPEGRIGGMFRVQGAFAPAPPPSIPVDWGREDHVQQLLGTSFDLSFERRITVEEWESGEAMWAFFAPRFGPVTTLVKKLPPDKAEEFKQAMIAYSEEAREGDKIIDRREYLLITGTRV